MKIPCLRPFYYPEQSFILLPFMLFVPLRRTALT